MKAAESVAHGHHVCQYRAVGNCDRLSRRERPRKRAWSRGQGTGAAQGGASAA